MREREGPSPEGWEGEGLFAAGTLTRDAERGFSGLAVFTLEA
jgi:hypothetical protein